MLRVLQIAMVLFVLSLILTLQQCSGEDEVVEKQSIEEVVSDKQIDMTQESKNIEKKQVTIKDKDNSTDAKNKEKNVSHIPKSHIHIDSKKVLVSTKEENESVVMQKLIAEMIKRNTRKTHKEMNNTVKQNDSEFKKFKGAPLN